MEYRKDMVVINKDGWWSFDLFDAIFGKTAAEAITSPFTGRLICAAGDRILSKQWFHIQVENIDRVVLKQEI